MLFVLGMVAGAVRLAEAPDGISAMALLGSRGVPSSKLRVLS
jgi:hypothetical protein